MIDDGPWVASPLCWLLSIPFALRCYILSVLYKNFFQYIVGFASNAIYDYLFAFIGFSITKFSSGHNMIWFDFSKPMSDDHNIQV